MALSAPAAPVDEPALRAWGTALGAGVSMPIVIALHGDLGAGKTTLAQAIAAGAGVTDDVTSPTFAMVHSYETARGALAHFDLYRLRSPEEVLALGWDDLLRSAAIVLVEWPERAGDYLPRPRYDITLHDDPASPATRRVEVSWTV